MPTIEATHGLVTFRGVAIAEGRQGRVSDEWLAAYTRKHPSGVRIVAEPVADAEVAEVDAALVEPEEPTPTRPRSRSRRRAA